MRDDRAEDVGIALDGEVEAPGERHAGLPETARLVVLLSLERGVPAITEQEAELLLKSTLHVERCGVVLVEEVASCVSAHVVGVVSQCRRTRART